MCKSVLWKTTYLARFITLLRCGKGWKRCIWYVCYFFLWLRITDEGSVPEMRIWSILLIKSDLKWCIHLDRSIFLYCHGRHRDTGFEALALPYFLSLWNLWVKQTKLKVMSSWTINWRNWLCKRYAWCPGNIDNLSKSSHLIPLEGNLAC